MPEFPETGSGNLREGEPLTNNGGPGNDGSESALHVRVQIPAGSMEIPDVRMTRDAATWEQGRCSSEDGGMCLMDLRFEGIGPITGRPMSASGPGH